jgi:predicted dehydrogenase
MRNQFNVLIIGAGNIGAFFDNPQSKNILTYAHAFTKHKGFNLIGFVDVSLPQAKKAANIWGGRAFRDLKQACQQNKIGVVVVAAPDETHGTILRNICNYPIKLVVAEKPLTATYDEAKKIVKLYQQKNIPLVVNYTRRFVPELEKIQSQIKQGYYGEFLTGIAYYGKGLLHNGSHTIDLLRWFIGEIKSSIVLNQLVDFKPSDPSLTAILSFAKQQKLYLQNVNCNLYTIFETDLLFTQGRIILKSGSAMVQEYKIKKNKIFEGYRNLAQVKEIKTQRPQALFNLVNNVYNFLVSKEPLKCDLINAYRTLKTCFQIKTSNKNDAKD